MRRFRALLGRILETAVIGITVSLAALVVVGVISRKAGVSLVFYDEVAAILLAWLTFYGAALAALHGAHIGFPNLVERVSASKRQLLLCLREVVIVAFFGLVAWYGTKLLSVLGGTFLVSLPWIPAWIVYSAVPIGALLVIVAEICAAIDSWTQDEPA